MWVETIRRYPVKSMAGQALDRARLGELGVPGDRAAYVVDAHGETLSARTRSGLLGLQGGLAADGTPTVDGHPWDDPRAAARVHVAAGPDARLALADSYERFDILPLLVVTTGAVEEAGIDVRRLRPNLVIGGVEGLAEREWEGRFLRVGRAIVHLANLRDRCIVTTYDPETLDQDVRVLVDIRRRFGGSLGLNAWVARAGHVNVGDSVELVNPPTSEAAPGWGRFVAVEAA
jgi:uncharacterized protein YcbX